MFEDVNRAKIVITNYHAFQLRERIELSKGGRQLLQGRGGEELDTQETEGQMLQRVMPALMGIKNILVINDEAHHCYREKPDDGDDEELKGDEKKEAEKNKKAARVWISGLEAVNRKLNVSRVIDLSARCPMFHARLPEHRDLEARLRLYLRLSPATRMLLASRRNLRQASQARSTMWCVSS
jgi:type III restriction enzyme